MSEDKSAKLGTKLGEVVAEKTETVKAAAKKAEPAKPRVAKQTAVGRELDEGAKTEQPDLTAVDSRGEATPAQYEDDGYGDVPVQMRGGKK